MQFINNKVKIMIMLLVAYLYKRLYLNPRLHKSGSKIRTAHFSLLLQPVEKKATSLSHALEDRKIGK